MQWSVLTVCVVAALVGATFTLADDITHTYKDSDEVTFWMNKVGPYHNPQETYAYYSLPFCHPEQKKKLRRSDEGMGSVLEGNELMDSGFSVKFKTNLDHVKICDLAVDAAMEKRFTEVITEHYWYQMYIDDLPVWGMIGELMATPPAANKEQGFMGFMYTHKEFSIAYNGDQIIEVNLTSEDARPIKAGETLPLTFSVQWVASRGSFEHRFDRYLDFDFFEHQIHWFSIFNSFVMVVFLCGLVALILMRTLKNDYARYTSEDEDMELDRVVDESGWKQVHGDVFRAPPFLELYSALVGTGQQLFVLVFLVIILTIIANWFADVHGERGMVTTTVVFLYCLTSIVAGYSGSGYYKRAGGDDWKRCMVFTGVLFPGVCFGVALLLNFIAVYYETLIAIPFGTMVSMLLLWLCVSCPMVLLGTIVGRSNTTKGDFPCRVNTLRRPIPDGPWYVRPWVLALFGGILPFGSIFIEMYFVFTSFWNYKFYYVYGFMLLVFLILLVVTVCVTIVSTYFLLNAEDYRWQWTAFCSGGSTALFVFLYAVYYFYTKTRMTGFLQTSFYFGYMGLFSFGLCILCGSIGFMGSDLFVRKIYQYIKSD